MLLHRSRRVRTNGRSRHRRAARLRLQHCKIRKPSTSQRIHTRVEAQTCDSLMSCIPAMLCGPPYGSLLFCLGLFGLMEIVGARSLARKNLVERLLAEHSFPSFHPLLAAAPSFLSCPFHTIDLRSDNWHRNSKQETAQRLTGVCCNGAASRSCARAVDAEEARSERARF